MANEQNLIPFQKGCKPGPGRPKGSVPMATVLKRFLEATVDVTRHPETGLPAAVTTRERIAMTWISKAMKGDMTAINTLVDRTDGKVAQKTELTGEDGAPLETMITVRSEEDQEILDRYYVKRKKLEQLDNGSSACGAKE